MKMTLCRIWRCAAVQTGCSCRPLTAASIIFVRKTLQVRPRDHKSVSFCKLGGQDLRFSMKMMLAPAHDLRDSLSELPHTLT